MEHINNTMSRSFLFMALLSIIVVAAHARGHHKGAHGRHMTAQNVTYDGKSMFINGRRELLFSGSIHYPRSTQDVSYSIPNHILMLHYSCKLTKLYASFHICAYQ